MQLQLNRASSLVAIICIIGACAEGSQQLPSTTDGNGGDGLRGESSGTSSSTTNGNGGTGGQGGLAGAGGQGGMGASGGMASSASSSSGAASSSSSAASSSSSAASSSSSSAASSSSSAASSSSSSSSGGGGCPGTIIDWNWNMGTGPTNLVYGGSTWAIGTATSGPGDGMTYLATSPTTGSYPHSVNDWAMLPAVDLSAYTACQLRLTVELWRNTEKVGLVNYDGGNLQYTLDASGATGWSLVGGAMMAYDGLLVQCSGACIVYNQQTWTSSANPKWKTAIYEGAMPPGPVVRLRFTFSSDVSNDVGPLAGIYVRRLQVEVF